MSRRSAEETELRKERIAMAPGGKLDIPAKYKDQLEGYKARWVLDKDGNLERYESYDYTYITKEDGSKLRVAAGGGNWLYAMKVLEEYWKQDFEAEQALVYDTAVSNAKVGSDQYQPRNTGGTGKAGEGMGVVKERDLI